ncbi:hypothetical protein [Actinophytocola sp. KF-1]
MGLFRGGDDEPLVVDWRAPTARPFYTATAAEPAAIRAVTPAAAWADV